MDVTLKAVDIGTPDSPKLAPGVWRRADVADLTTELAQMLKPHQTIVLKICAGGARQDDRHAFS